MSRCLTVCERIIVYIDGFIEWLGKTVSWLTLFMVLTSLTIVILRYLFDIGWIALQETVSYMHATVFMLGVSYTLKHNEHVRVDIFYEKFPNRLRHWIDCLGCLLFLLPVSLFIIYTSWEYVADAWRIEEGSRHSGGLPGLYLLKSSIIVMSTLLTLQGISLFLRNLLSALGVSIFKESD